MTARDVDAWVLRLLQLLDAEGPAAYTAERLVRIGLFHPAPDVALAAQKVGVCRRGLASQLARAHLPSPKALLSWGRVLRGLHRYRTGESLEKAAAASDFQSQGALSQAVIHHTGMRAVEWRKAGADMDALLRAFVETHRQRVAA